MKKTRRKKKKISWVEIIETAATVFVAVVLVLCVLTKYMDPRNSPYIALLGTISPVLVLLNLLLIIFLVIRRKLIFIFPLIALIVNIGYFKHVWIGDGHNGNTEAGDRLVKVMSCKIILDEGDNGNSISQSLKLIADHNDVDVICLQGNSEAHTDLEDSINWKYKSQDVPKSSLSIFSKYPIIDSKVYDKNGSIYAVGCKIVKENDTICIVDYDLNVNNGATSSYGSAVESVHIAENLRLNLSGITQPLLMAGSLNQNFNSYAYHVLSTDLMDVFYYRGSGLSATLKPRWLLRQEQFIFCNKRIIPLAIIYKWEDWNQSALIISSLKL